jgi:hypothetical protein
MPVAARPAAAQPPATAILQPEGYLFATPQEVLTEFGWDVAIDGNTAVVGAPRATNADRDGRVYILTRIGPSWVREAVLVPPPAEPGDSTSLRFGAVVDISGDTIVVGSTGSALGYNAASGVFVFRRGGTGWQLEATLRPDAPTPAFGMDVAIDGDTILVGSPLRAVRCAYVFTRTGTIWTKQGELRTSDPAAQFMGGKVAIDGSTAIVGALVADAHSTRAGAAYVFTRAGDTWLEQAKLAAPDGVTAAGVRWGLAEGRVGGPEGYQTYVLLANTGAIDADVTIAFLRTDGTTVTKMMTVPAASRMNVAIAGAGSDVPELADESFGALIDAAQPIVVERSMYSNANGVTWAAGTNATATPLQ